MTQFFHAAVQVLAAFFAAGAATAALKTHRQPAMADLKALGIRQDDFSRIRL